MRVWLVVLAGCGRFDFDSAARGDGGLPDGSIAAAYASAVLADDPVAYFHFDETGGTARSAVGAYAGAYTGSFAFGAAGAMAGSRAVTFDGATTSIDLGDQFPFAGLAPYSVELWMRPTALGSTRFLFDRSTGTDGYTCYVGDTFTTCSRTAASTEMGYCGISSPPPLATWEQLVVTFDGTIPRLYINGVLVNDNQGGSAPIGSGAGDFVIGDVTGGQFFKLQGDLDELSIYDHALADARIAAHFAAAH